MAAFLVITLTLFAVQNAGEQKLEMEELKRLAAEENIKLEKRKKAIDIELIEIEPIVRVGNSLMVTNPIVLLL